MIVEEALLATKLEELERLLPASGNLRGLLESFLRTAADDELVRINPVAFAQRHGCDEAALIDLFLHGRKVGLLRNGVALRCSGCGDIVESFQSLTSATAHFFCQVCSADRDADLSDFIEITFSVSKEIRESRYHDPWSLSPEEFFFTYRFTESGVVDDGSPLREHLRRHAVLCAFVEPGETVTFEATPGPEYLWFTNGPALIVGDDRTDEIRRFAFEYVGTRSEGYREEIAAGPMVVDFSNATEDSISGNSGALVKTIGDAVMASFHDPLDAVRAALDMHAQIARFNTEADDDLIALKVGVHVGTCLAVTLNGRLDYFGQAVNLAARVQALSEANEIHLTDELLSTPGAGELLAAFATEARSVRFKGVHGDVRVHRVRPGVPAAT